MNSSTKYFFNRSFEILHSNSFDSYRLSLNNPYIIFYELNTVADKYSKKKVKHFKPTVSDVGSEAFDFLKNQFLKDLLVFNPFSQKQITELLETTCVKEKNDKKTRSIRLISKTILTNNSDFKSNLINQIKLLIAEDKEVDYNELDTLTGWLISQLIFNGFSKYYIETRFRKCADSIFKKGVDLNDAFDRLNLIFSSECSSYKVYFKIKVNSEYKLQFISKNITEIKKLPDSLKNSKFVNSKFKESSIDEIFVQVSVDAQDFWSSISVSHQILTESIEINILHHSTNKITIENQAIALHSSSGKFRMDTIEEEVDGFYHQNEMEFNRFVENLKGIESFTAKEKISSAIRFYKLGNDSAEMEHKILNYWIGFEQLFSAIDTDEDSITRMKTFYTALNITYYFQRRVNYLLDSLSRNKFKYKRKKITSKIFEEIFDKTKLTGTNPLFAHRIEKYVSLNNRKDIQRYVEQHTNRLNQHLTRLYRVRNELVHEGKTKMNVRLLAGHLRHYLLFSIEQITHELCENPSIEKIDDAFVYYENMKERIKHSENLSEILKIKEYKGYME